ncbi:hypothetical protein C5167_007484 [Papaver somniferum]|nr:hypothetical protein C5167_007484 [Papaver somniferum]
MTVKSEEIRRRREMKKMAAAGFILLHLIIFPCLFITISAECTTSTKSNSTITNNNDGWITVTNTTTSWTNCTSSTSSTTTTNSVGSIVVNRRKGTGAFSLFVILIATALIM